jgi:hypothetical protein
MKIVETANIAVTGEVYPKISETACSGAHMVALIETRGYSAIASCVVEHIITNTELKESERLYYLLTDLFANYNRSKHGAKARTATLPAAIWDKCLNLREEYVFVLQKSLEQKGYFHIHRQKYDNQNEINVITPTLPNDVFENMKLSPNRNNNRDTATSDRCQRSYLDDTKMFVRFNNKQIEFLIRDQNLTPLQKLMWVFLYLRSSFSYQSSGDRRSTLTQSELCLIFKCTQSTASKALNRLEEFGFITKNQYKTLDSSTESNRRKKSVWFIEALFPMSAMHSLLQQKERANINNDHEYVTEVYNAVDKINYIPKVKGEYSERSGVYSQGSGEYSESSVISIKDITTKSIFIKNNKQQTCSSSEVLNVYFDKKQNVHEINAPQDLQAQSLFDVDIVEEKYRSNIRKLTPEQVLKATNFARKLKRERLCSSDLIDVSESELSRQFIHHAANFKMTKLNCKTRDEEIEAALSFAWTAAQSGRWRCPAGWGNAIDLHLEREKYIYEYPDDPKVCKFENKVKRYLDS